MTSLTTLMTDTSALCCQPMFNIVMSNNSARLRNFKNLPPSNVRLSNPEHVDRGLVQLDKHPVEDLAQTQQLQNFANLWADTVDTRNDDRSIS